MTERRNIITVGFNPVWDRTCYIDGIEWGNHREIASQTLVPAGKALNINRALAWMSVPSTAAGLWGSADYPAMLENLSAYQGLIHPAFTIVNGTSRQNVTVVDTRRHREMHLRSTETLVTRDALNQLSHALSEHLTLHGTVIFAGSIPPAPFLEDCIALIQTTGRYCTERVVDTSGAALAKLVEQGGIDVIKPNLQELSELLGRPVDSNVEAVVRAARQLCDRINVIIVSMGWQGAVAVTKENAWYGRSKTHHRTVHTVGCGDYLMAGYLTNTAQIPQKLAAGIKAAAAKAWGWVGAKSWDDVQQLVEVDINFY